jgi:hypothetical protein
MAQVTAGRSTPGSRPPALADRLGGRLAGRPGGRLAGRLGRRLAGWLGGVLVLAPGLVLATVLAGCVAPAPDLHAYRGKAARTAGDALSELQTVRLTAGAATHGRMTRAYADVLVTGAEQAYGAVQQAFDSVQPPDDPAADRARAALDGILGDGADLIGELRIALRRERNGEVDRLAAALAPVADRLDGYDPAAP